MPPQAAQHRPSPPATRTALDALRRLRSRARALLLARAGLLTASAVGGGVFVGALLDYLLRLPEPARWVLLAAGAAGLVVLVWRVLLPAWAFKPSLTTLALRLRAADPGVRASLPAGVDLAQSPEPSDPMERALRDEALARAGEGFDAAGASRLLRWREAGKAAVLALSLVALLGTIAVQWPDHSRTGVQRVLTPWSEARWPRRYPVVDLYLAAVHPIDQHLPLRAALVRTPDRIGAGAVEAHYRIVEGEGLLARAGPTRRVVLTDQQRGVDLVDGSAPHAEQGRLFERLIEPAAFEGPREQGRAVFFEYWLATRDDRSVTRRVRLVRRPALEQATASVTPPAYAADAGAEGGILTGRVPVGSAALGPVLAGSRVEVELRFNKPLPVGERPEWLAPLDEASPEPALHEPDGAVLRIAAAPDRSASITVGVTDEHGLSPSDPVVISLEVIPDAAPEAVIAEPAHDEAVLATAVVTIEAEGRDDLGVAWAHLVREVARAPEDSSGAPPEPGSPETLARAEPGAPFGRRLALGHTLDLAPLGLTAGDEVRLWAVAQDSLGAWNPAAREPSLSPVRTLRVIAQAELVEQMRGELAGLRRTLERLDAEQAELEGLLGDPEAGVAQRQAALSQRIELQQALVQRLAQRQDRNALDDEALRGLLADAGSLLESARRSSDEAAADADTPEARREVEQAQSRVRDDLGRLAELLDRGEDGWLVRRDVERLLAEQRRLREETAAAGGQTVGRSLDQLDARELTTLERIAQRQRDAAEQAAAAVDELADRARQLAQADPAQSAAMSSAAARARERQVGDRLAEAAEQIAQNQTGLAQQAQDDAIEALEGVLDELDQADRARDSALRRQLASLVDSIKALITRQERELERLPATPDLASLGEGLIALNQNTLSVLAQTQADPALAGVGASIDRASQAQREAIAAARSGEDDRAEVERLQRASLVALRRALEEAEAQLQQAEQREQDRVRRELRQAYREALEEQAALTGQTEPLIGQDLTRRQRSDARALSGRQDELRGRLAELLTRTEGLADARVFALAHRRLDTLMTDAAADLAAGTPTPRTARHQRSATQLLASLTEALKDPAPPSSDFDTGQQQAGGGQGGQGQGGQPQPAIPPVAELMLLRSMQEQVRTLTRDIDDAPGAPAQTDIAEAATLQRDLSEHAAELIQRLQAPPQEPGP